jgi:hypothetical protein
MPIVIVLLLVLVIELSARGIDHEQEHEHDYELRLGGWDDRVPFLSGAYFSPYYSRPRSVGLRRNEAVLNEKISRST